MEEYVGTIYKFEIGNLVLLGSSTTVGLIVERGPSPSLWRSTEGMYKLLVGEKFEWKVENILTLVSTK